MGSRESREANSEAAMAAVVKSEVEECLYNLQTTNKGVRLIIITNLEGVPIRWLPPHLPPETVVQHAGLISDLALSTEKAIEELDSMNDWCFLRVRSHKHEILVCPEKEFLMIVIQDPNVQEGTEGKPEGGT